MQMAATPAETWDFEWDYTQGKLEDQTGWAIDKSGTASSSLISTGEKITTLNSSYFQIYPRSDGIHADLRRFDTNGYGVVEASASGYFSTGNVPNLRITAAASTTKRVTLYPCNGKWRVMDNNTITAGTAIADYADNTEYTIRIVLKDTTADIYINGTLVKADQSTATTLYGGINSPMGQNMGSGRYAVLKSFKIKKGRIN